MKRYVFTGASVDEIAPLLRRYHYRRTIPAAPLHCYAMREAGGLFGDTGEVVAGCIFSWPMANWAEYVVELTRLVRHPSYDEPLTKFLSLSLSYVRKHADLVVSMADKGQNHHGGIYQAAGWNYHGERAPHFDGFLINGQYVNRRTVAECYGTIKRDEIRALNPSHHFERHYDEGKHLYWKALKVSGKTKAKRLGLWSTPYPKPSAASPLDERHPSRVSFEHPEVAAPELEWWREDVWFEPVFAFMEDDNERASALSTLRQAGGGSNADDRQDQRGRDAARTDQRA
jgi:hypothetical protein